jgi:Xaa-Pro dipeptidase
MSQRPLLHFSPGEFAERQRRTLAAMRSQGLDALLLFRQESMYYLTGYDTMGYITFQCLILHVSGRCTLLTREPDRRAAKLTSTIEDVRIYMDDPKVNPATSLREIAAEYGLQGATVGVEYNAFGLSAARARLVEHAFEGFCTLQDASDLVSDLRLIKSAAEIAYVEKAAELADRALRLAIDMARPGVGEGEIFGAMQADIFANGGDYTASRWILGCGDHAMLVRHFTGHHLKLQKNDQLQLELGAAYLHYHACLFHTIYVGEVSSEQRRMHAAAVESLAEVQLACKPGNTVGDMFDRYARVAERHGMTDFRLNACGYSLGATYPPTWMDGALICRGNLTPIQPNMVFFPHMVYLDSNRKVTGCAGQTLLVTQDGCRALSSIPFDLYAKVA